MSIIVQVSIVLSRMNEVFGYLFVFFFRYKGMKDLKDKIHTRFTDLMEMASGYEILFHL